LFVRFALGDSTLTIAQIVWVIAILDADPRYLVLMWCAKQRREACRVTATWRKVSMPLRVRGQRLYPAVELDVYVNVTP
jgi:hypothetical protein